MHSGFPSVFEMEILEPSRPAYSGGALMRGYACNVLSQLRPRAFYAYLFHVFQVWDSSETHFTTSFFVFCRSGTECHSTQYFYCVLLARDRVCFETAFMSCCVGQDQVVFSYAIRASLIVTYKGCSGISIYIKFCPSLSIEWTVRWLQANWEGRLEAGKFFRELVTRGHICMLVITRAIHKFDTLPA